MKPPTIDPFRAQAVTSGAVRTLWTLPEHLFDSIRHAGGHMFESLRDSYAQAGVGVLETCTNVGIAQRLGGGREGELSLRERHALVAPHCAPHIARFPVTSEGLLDAQSPKFGKVLIVRPRSGIAATKVLVHSAPEVSQAHAHIIAYRTTCLVTATLSDCSDT